MPFLRPNESAENPQVSLIIQIMTEMKNDYSKLANLTTAAYDNNRFERVFAQKEISRLEIELKQEKWTRMQQTNFAIWQTTCKWEELLKQRDTEVCNLHLIISNIVLI